MSNIGILEVSLGGYRYIKELLPFLNDYIEIPLTNHPIEDSNNLKKIYSFEEAKEIIMNNDIHLLLLDTGNFSDLTYDFLIDLKKDWDFKLISIVDLFGNYEKRLKFKPDYVLAPSNKVKSEIEALYDCPVYSVGSPKLNLSKKYTKEINREKPDVVFISQPHKNRAEIISKFYKALEEIYKNNFNFYIKTHYLEDKAKFNFDFDFEFVNKKNMFKVLNNYDLALSNNSTLIYELDIVGMPSVALYKMETNLLEVIQAFKSGNSTKPYMYYSYWEEDAVKKNIDKINKIRGAISYG